MKRTISLALIGISAVTCALAIAIDPTVIEAEKPKATRRRYAIGLDTSVVDWAGRPKGGDA